MGLAFSWEEHSLQVRYLLHKLKWKYPYKVCWNNNAVYSFINLIKNLTYITYYMVKKLISPMAIFHQEVPLLEIPNLFHC